MDDNQKCWKFKEEIYLADLDDMNLGTVHVQQGADPFDSLNEVGNKFTPTVIVDNIFAKERLQCTSMLR